jgi:hypothetical protein
MNKSTMVQVAAVGVVMLVIGLTAGSLMFVKTSTKTVVLTSNNTGVVTSTVTTTVFGSISMSSSSTLTGKTNARGTSSCYNTASGLFITCDNDFATSFCYNSVSTSGNTNVTSCSNSLATIPNLGVFLGSEINTQSYSIGYFDINSPSSNTISASYCVSDGKEVPAMCSSIIPLTVSQPTCSVVVSTDIVSTTGGASGQGCTSETSSVTLPSLSSTSDILIVIINQGSSTAIYELAAR